MESAVAQMNVFFMVTTAVVVVVGILAVVMMVYIIKFVRDARIIIRAIRDEAAEIVDDVEDFRHNIKDKAGKVSGILGAITTARFIRRIFKD